MATAKKSSTRSQGTPIREELFAQAERAARLPSIRPDMRGLDAALEAVRKLVVDKFGWGRCTLVVRADGRVHIRGEEHGHSRFWADGDLHEEAESDVCRRPSKVFADLLDGKRDPVGGPHPRTCECRSVPHTQTCKGWSY